MLCPLRLDIDRLPEGSPAWPLDEALVKRHCRVNFADDDAELQVYLKAAIEWAETETHRTIFQRTHRWVLRDFPRDTRQEIRLPRGKTQWVERISYSNNGALSALIGPSTGSPGGTDFQEDLRGDDGGVLMPARGATWPSVDSDVPAPVTIEFNAGWLAEEIPFDVIHAILLGTEDGYDLRGSNDLAALNLAKAGDNLAARVALMSPYNLTRWY